MTSYLGRRNQMVSRATWFKQFAKEAEALGVEDIEMYEYYEAEAQMTEGKTPDQAAHHFWGKK